MVTAYTHNNGLAQCVSTSIYLYDKRFWFGAFVRATCVDVLCTSEMHAYKRTNNDFMKILRNSEITHNRATAAHKRSCVYAETPVSLVLLFCDHQQMKIGIRAL